MSRYLSLTLCTALLTVAFTWPAAAGDDDANARDAADNDQPRVIHAKPLIGSRSDTETRATTDGRSVKVEQQPQQRVEAAPRHIDDTASFYAAHYVDMSQGKAERQPVRHLDSHASRRTTAEASADRAAASVDGVAYAQPVSYRESGGASANDGRTVQAAYIIEDDESPDIASAYYQRYAAGSDTTEVSSNRLTYTGPTGYEKGYVETHSNPAYVSYRSGFYRDRYYYGGTGYAAYHHRPYVVRRRPVYCGYSYYTYPKYRHYHHRKHYHSKPYYKHRYYGKHHSYGHYRYKRHHRKHGVYFGYSSYGYGRVGYSYRSGGSSVSIGLKF